MKVRKLNHDQMLRAFSRHRDKAEVRIGPHFYYWVKCGLIGCDRQFWGRGSMRSRPLRLRPGRLAFCCDLHWWEHARRMQNARRARWWRRHHHNVRKFQVRPRRRPLRPPPKRVGTKRFQRRIRRG